MNALLKIVNSSTAVFGSIVAALTTWAGSSGLPLPPWLSAVLIGGYALKEAAAKIGDGLSNAPAPAPAPIPPYKP